MSESSSSIGRAVVAVGAAVAVAAGVAWALAHGDSGGRTGWPTVYGAAGIAFVVQWVAFVPAYLRRTEHFYDLVGTVTYLGVTWFSVWHAGALDARALLVAGLVTVWSLRLGTFLFRRVRRAGKDGRFDEIKHDPGRFVVVWTMQGLWVFLTLAAALVVVVDAQPAALGWLDAVGVALWGVGFAFEAVADAQKSRFKQDDRHQGQFIDVGLWAWSRHPNYFGEIVLWLGVGVIALTAMSGWTYVGLVSPVFVTVLLTKVSGIPLLEARADEKWGGQPDYEAYKRRTAVLVPRPPRPRDVPAT